MRARDTAGNIDPTPASFSWTVVTPAQALLNLIASVNGMALPGVANPLNSFDLALERLTESSGGQLLYELPHPRRNGSTHLLLDPLELIEKLSVLIPAPRFHLLRFHALLAPHGAVTLCILSSNAWNHEVV